MSYRDPEKEITLCYKVLPKHINDLELIFDSFCRTEYIDNFDSRECSYTDDGIITTTGFFAPDDPEVVRPICPYCNYHVAESNGVCVICYKENRFSKQQLEEWSKKYRRELRKRKAKSSRIRADSVRKGMVPPTEIELEYYTDEGEIETVLQLISHE
uniref:Uncharacterized protein n=1 Tax=viral metagenome TaxID=1070528 RepID=A0A6C0EKT0_9ZZZZ